MSGNHHPHFPGFVQLSLLFLCSPPFLRRVPRDTKLLANRPSIFGRCSLLRFPRHCFCFLGSTPNLLDLPLSRCFPYLKVFPPPAMPPFLHFLGTLLGRNALTFFPCAQACSIVKPPRGMSWGSLIPVLQSNMFRSYLTRCIFFLYLTLFRVSSGPAFSLCFFLFA